MFAHDLSNCEQHWTLNDLEKESRLAILPPLHPTPSNVVRVSLPHGGEGWWLTYYNHELFADSMETEEGPEVESFLAIFQRIRANVGYVLNVCCALLGLRFLDSLFAMFSNVHSQTPIYEFFDHICLFVPASVMEVVRCRPTSWYDIASRPACLSYAVLPSSFTIWQTCLHHSCSLVSIFWWRYFECLRGSRNFQFYRMSRDAILLRICFEFAECQRRYVFGSQKCCHFFWHTYQVLWYFLWWI